MALMEDYQTIVQVDLGLVRAKQRRDIYDARGDVRGAAGQRHVIDRLLDRRLELMKARTIA